VAQTSPQAYVVEEHMSWVRSRMALDAELMEGVHRGMTWIGASFGSFAILQGIVGAAGEGEGFTSPSRGFSLVAIVIGIVLILIAADHNRKMTIWVNQEEFSDGEAPELPDERRPFLIAAAAVIL
jgi:hypothetical protein